MAQKSILSMNTLCITKGEKEHGTNIVDLRGKDSGIDRFPAPFDCIVDYIQVFDNTIIFKSTEAVEIPSISQPVRLTFRCTHMNDDMKNQLGIQVGKRFNQGETCYYEGTKGKAEGNHIHIEWALRWPTGKKFGQVNGLYQLITDMPNNRIHMWEAVFLAMETKLVAYPGSSANDIIWTYVNGDRRSANGFFSVPSAPNPSSSVRMKLTGSAAYLRNEPAGLSIRTTVPNQAEIAISEFYANKAKDQYRWCWGSYNGISGAFQYDPKVMRPIGSVNNGSLKMKLDASAARIRSTVLGAVLTTAPKGSEITILEFLSDKAADGYYWCKGTYQNTQGYFQYDPAVMYPYGKI